MGKLKHKAPTIGRASAIRGRDLGPSGARPIADAVRLKYRSAEADPSEGEPSHINAREARLLETLMPEAAGPVITKGLLAEAGHRGDDRVTKLIPAEAALLKRRGGAGTPNPETGLLQYYDGGDDGDDGGMSGGVGNDSLGSSDTTGSPGGDTHNDGGFGDGGGLGYRSYDPTTMPSIDSLLNTPNGYRAEGYEGLSMMQYSPPDTFGRLLDTYRYGPPPSYTARGQAPGRYGAPTGLGPGIVGTLAAKFGGPAMSGLMSLGMHMDQAMSPQSRAASMAANEAQGTKNSTGQDAPADLEARASGTQYAGTASGAQTAQQPQIPPGYTLNPAGQLIPIQGGGNDRAAWKTPAENLLYDYIWRGPSGRGRLG